MEEHVVERVVSDIHIVTIERLQRKVINRVRWKVIHGLVKVGGQESAMVLVNERGGGGIDGHDTVSPSLDSAGLEDLAQFPARVFWTGRICRCHVKVGTGVGGCL